MKRYGIAIIALSFFLVGCQPTPEQEIIKQKEDINKVVEEYDKSRETISVEESQGEMADEILLSTTLSVPDTVSFELSAENGLLKVIANEAKVIVPNVAHMGAATITRNDFDESELKSVAEILFEGNVVYEPKPLLKSDYQVTIDNAYAYIEELKKIGQEELIPTIEAEIAFRQEQMLKAPETWELTEEDFVWKAEENVQRWHIDGVNSETDWLYRIYASKMESEYSLDMVSVSKENDSTYSLVEETFLPYYFNDAEIANLLAVNKCVYSAEQAADLSIEFLQSLGISTENLYVAEVVPAVKENSMTRAYEEGIYGYVVYLGHGVVNVASTWNRNWISQTAGTTELEGDNEGKVPYQYEELFVVVGNDGVERVAWNNPMEVTNILSEDVALLSYNDIETIMFKYLGDAYANYVLNYKGYDSLSDIRSEDAVLEIDRIVLGMMRVQNPDDENNYTLIPVWDIFPKGNIITYPNHQHSMLTINAMDGSIIRRENGY